VALKPRIIQISEPIRNQAGRDREDDQQESHGYA
jgi:hypothetical protein